MGISIDDVTAVIPTRGNVDMTRILATLPYKDVIVFDNSQQEFDYKTFGRYVGAARARNSVIYFQDDDVIFTKHEELCAEYEPNRITTNMPDPWYTANQYDILQQALVGAGSLCDQFAWTYAFDRYLAKWPYDDQFLNNCDFIFGQLTPYHRIDLGYEILPHASAPGRIYTTEGAHDRKMIVVNRAIDLRT